jgi:membrane fusion protein (multidrug efflux system)
VLEAARRVSIRAADDGIVRELKVNLGDRVKRGHEVALLDQAEAVARVEIAKAELARRKALASEAKTATDQQVAAAEIQEAEAHLQLAQIALARLTLKTPIDGRVLDVPLSAGQYVRQGDEIADIADESLLTALVPVDRTTVRLGQKIELPAGDVKVSGMIRALVPLPRSMASLYELNGNWGAAMVQIPNTDDMLEPGQRLDPGSLPEQPVATIEARALSQDGSPSVQVLRDDHAVRIPVRVFGGRRTGRLQVSGAFRPTDLLVVSSNPPLADGTFVRFGSTSPSTSEPPSTPAPVPPPVAQRPSPATTPAPSTRPSPTPRRPTPSQPKPAPKPAPASVAPF